MSLAAVSVPEVKTMVQKKILQAKGLNSHASLEKFAQISPSTLRRYRSFMNANSRQAKEKPTSRVEPFLNIRNAITKCAGLTAISKVCPAENIFSEDEVGVFLFGWHNDAARPKLVSTSVADQFLRKNNISLSTSTDPNQQRVAHIGAIQGHTGQLNSYYLRIVDYNFPEEFKSGTSEHKPLVWRMSDASNFFVVTCHPSVTDTTASEYISKLVTHPAIFESQDATIQREVRAYNLTKPVSTVSGTLPVDSEAEGMGSFNYCYHDLTTTGSFVLIDAIREKYKWTTLIRDGAYGPISGGPEMDNWNRGKGRQMFMAKWSAGCSMSESPKDAEDMSYVEAKISVVGSVENIGRWLIGMTMCASIRKQAMDQWFGEYESEWRRFSLLHATNRHFQVHTNQIHAIPMIPSPP
jgi:hypothetical protein